MSVNELGLVLVTPKADVYKRQVSSELLSDNTAGLLRYLAGWFGPKYILTKNTLLLELLKGLETEVPLTAGKEAKELRMAMITKLNTAHSMVAVSYTHLQA